jgi:hypothetical protein
MAQPLMFMMIMMMMIPELLEIPYRTAASASYGPVYTATNKCCNICRLFSTKFSAFSNASVFLLVAQ